MTQDWLRGFAPDPDALFDALLPDIDDGVLREIAASEFGLGMEEHLAPLRRFRDRREVPALNWHPREALDLLRWSEPDDPDGQPWAAGPRGHLRRAFACALLFRSYPEPPNRESLCWYSFNETAIQLAESLRALGGRKHSAGIRFLAWCVEALPPLEYDGNEAPFLGLALLSLAHDHPTARDEDIVALCAWIDRQVSDLLVEEKWAATRDHDWLLSTNHHDQRNAKWIDLGRSLYRSAEAEALSERSTWIARIGRSLAEV